MRIVQTYSHLNGEEFLQVHRAKAYQEIREVIQSVNAFDLRTKTSREKTMRGKKLYSPPKLNQAFRKHFHSLGWAERRYDYCVTTNREYLESLTNLSLAEQREFLQSKGIKEPDESYKQTDFVKDRIAVEVQFGKYSFVAYDLFVKHLLFYTGSVIDVGVEILPVKAMAKDPKGGRTMSTGIAYYEGEVYNILRHGRSSPPVPLVLIGICP